MPKGFRGGFGGLGNIGKLMKEAEKAMQRIDQVKDELMAITVEASSGGGMVKVTANGAGAILSIKIAPEVVDPDDVEMLEDLVLAAVKDALEQSATVREEKMAEATGGLPGLPGLP